MKQELLLATVVAGVVLSAGCVKPVSVVGSGTLATFESDVSGFSRIDASHSLDVNVVQSSGHSVELTCDDNMKEYLVVKKSGDTLVLGLKEGRSYTNTTLRARVTMPECKGVELSGSSSADLTGFISNRPLELQLSGSSTVNLVGVECSDVEMNLSGSSDVGGHLVARDVVLDLSGSSRTNLAGSGEHLDANCSGSSDVTLENFAVQTADINLSGASTAWLTVDQKLRVDLSGGSRVVYYGDAKLADVNLSGDSTIERG
jgi:hypothetical protein